MKTFAHLSGNVVINTIAGENIDDVKAVVGNDVVEYTAENPAGIGWTYDPETGLFTAPDTLAETPPAQ